MSMLEQQEDLQTHAGRHLVHSSWPVTTLPTGSYHEWGVGYLDLSIMYDVACCSVLRFDETVTGKYTKHTSKRDTVSILAASFLIYRHL